MSSNRHIESVKFRGSSQSDFQLVDVEYGHGDVMSLLQESSRINGSDDKKRAPSSIISYLLDSGGDFGKRKSDYYVIPLLVLIWYLSAIVAITTSKKVMILHPYPFMLCTSQFLVATLATYLIIRTPSSITSMQSGARNVVIQIATSYTFGFIFTNVAFSIGKSASSPLLAPACL
jgi:hypothetical protein